MSQISGTINNFNQEVTSFKGKVLVDFWAPWCGPCQMLTPIVEEIEKEHPEIKIVKINVDEEPQLSSDCQVQSIPTVMIYDSGLLKNTIVGFRQKADYLKALKS